MSEWLRNYVKQMTGVVALHLEAQCFWTGKEIIFKIFQRTITKRKHTKHVLLLKGK